MLHCIKLQVLASPQELSLNGPIAPDSFTKGELYKRTKTLFNLDRAAVYFLIAYHRHIIL
jgi:hypothetical protein